ncbi:hypothetical protein AKJ09_09019 [Labilithrix luteola]|uniref:TonB C-terminal domain-containing protein n=1 Tax=Labilithrix luteola TaxID=1391654 RepID=A0A0K1Q986_9BACT|nr:hypothetical protein [Labilithrix luteola]AKV02356.1 hypothetical protein AKJ09_09019 [Labilithrix luteola]
MSIAGERPESGVRIALERPRDGGPPWSYTGAAYVPDDTFALKVLVTAEGTVEVEVQAKGDSGNPPPADLAEKVRLIVRTAFRQAKTDDEPPARRIVRWRGEK